MKSAFYITVIFLIVVLSIGCSSTSQYNLLQMPGQEKNYHPTMPEGELVPYSKAFETFNGLVALQNPEPKKYTSVAFARLPLKPGDIYRFSMEAVGAEGIEFAAFASEISGGNIRYDRPLLRGTLFLNVNGMTQYSKEFALSPGAEGIIPAITFFTRNGMLRQKFPVILKQLSIEKTGRMQQAPKSIASRNLAAHLNPENYPIGKFPDMYKGNGKSDGNGSDVQADIVSCPDGTKALHVVRKAENYIYPHMELENFPFSPQYHYVRISFQAKGKGRFQAGLWWKRQHMEWDYENAFSCQLTDNWQTFTFFRPCLTPDVVSATIDFNSREDGEYFIRQISAHLE